MQERARTLGEVYALTDFLYLPSIVVDPEEWERGVRRHPAFSEVLQAALDRYAVLDDWTAAAIHDATVAAGEDAGVTQARQGPGADPAGDHRAIGRSAPLGVARGARPRPDDRPAGGGPPPGRPGLRGSVIARRVVRWPLRVVLAAAGLVVAYLLFNFAQVWWASRLNQARPAQAIVVLGAAQYNGVPSPDLRARLDQALLLWRAGLAPVVVVTGGKEPGDAYTEATAGATYLEASGVPPADIVAEGTGRNSWQSLVAAASMLGGRHATRVLLVSDPFHDKRIALMAGELGLTPYVSPTRTSPIRGVAVIPYFAKETVEVALGRIIGFRRLTGVSRRVQQATTRG